MTAEVGEQLLQLSNRGPLLGPLGQILRESVRLVWYFSKTRSQQPYRHGSGEFSLCQLFSCIAQTDCEMNKE